MEALSETNTEAERRKRRRVSVQTIREAADNAVGRVGLRQVARDARVSAPALSGFLDGTEPRDPTLAKLREWYFSEAAARSAVTVVSARAAVSLLTSGLPEEDRRMAILGILTCLHGIWTRRGSAAPEWLVALMAEMHSQPAGR